ncbi:MAG: hypothetical protein IPK01_16750 [Acidobacteria bacterium]|nr:hypothetical protein [Acidobacteriota bacterium]
MTSILVEQDLITRTEVSFLVTPDVRQERSSRCSKKCRLQRRTLAEARVDCVCSMPVLVSGRPNDEEEHLRGMLITRRSNDIDIRMLDFEMPRERR